MNRAFTFWTARIFSALLCIFLYPLLYAQPTISQQFTTENGLPSNVVYQILQDKKGYLWLATEQGAAQFDGKNIRVFGKDKGVPDNEVLRITMEKNGRIWILCYNNGIAYFNAYLNRFVDLTSLAEKLGVNKIQKMITLKGGGIQFDTDKKSYIFTERNLLGASLHSSTENKFICKLHTDGSDYQYKIDTSNNTLNLYHYRGNTLLQQRNFGHFGEEVVVDVIEDALYIFKKRSTEYFIVANLTQPLTALTIQKKYLQQPYYIHSFNDNYLTALHRTTDSKNGKDILDAYVYDIRNSNFLFTLKENAIAYSVLKDKNENIWLSTLYKGIMVYKQSNAITQCLSNQFRDTKFFSVYQHPDGGLFAGNEKGEIVEQKENTETIHHVAAKDNIEWQRNILYSQNKLFTFSDGGIYVNYHKEIKENGVTQKQASKVILALNDSLVLSGYEGGLHLLNTKAETLDRLPISEINITALASVDKEKIYVGATDGLHIYSMHTKQLINFQNNDVRFKERIVAMYTQSDSTLWVATATNGVLVLKQDKIIGHLREVDGLNSNNCLALTNGKENEMCLATVSGISRIRFTYSRNSFVFSVSNLSKVDGLPPTIYQLFYTPSMLYAATDHGLYRIPDSVTVPQITIDLIGVTINQQDTIVAKDYKLKSTQRTIQLKFAAANLQGYFSHVQYSSDEGKSWSSLKQNELNLNSSSGINTVWVRAVDVNKNTSSSILKLSFDIATPFYKTLWFWIFTMLFIQLGIGYALYKRRQQRESERRKVELAKAHLASLEQQAFTSLMNPHFMFNSLNSIQHYINHQDRQNANRYLSDFASLIRKNFEAAQQAFIPLEQELENISLYVRLEQMRFNDKFTFNLQYVDDLDPDDWMMPTMILQPLIENALLHGMMPSQIAGELILRLSYQHNDLLLEVIDNGIGVENSRALKQGSSHRSRGMELIYKRLHALSFFSKQALHLVYSVPYTDEKNPGNKISLLIPDDLYKTWKKAQSIKKD